MSDFGISDKYQNISKEMQEARLRLIDFVIETGLPVNKNEAIKICGNESLYKELLEKEIITANGEDIAFLYPVSAQETNHIVKLSDGREFFSMCAIDSLGAYSLFHKDVEINSICSNTGNKIYIKIKDRKIFEHYPNDIHVIHVDLNKNKNWASTC